MVFGEMLFFGHVGPAAFLAQRLGLHVLATMFFAILPDIVDKTLFVWGIVPYARHIAHSLLFLAAVVALLELSGRKMLARCALVGIASHYFLDLRHFLPVLYPFVQYEWPAIRYGAALDSIALLFEALGLIFVAGAWDDLKREFQVIEAAVHKSAPRR